VRIHDLGEIGGVKYFTMPFIEGRNLAAVIAEAGKLPVERTLRVHARSPPDSSGPRGGRRPPRSEAENVMLDADDTAIIMDFGIARSTEGTSATLQGAVIGTISYMAPEQAQGQP